MKFEEISKLMDKRLYRMRRLFWGVKNKVPKDEIENRMDQYRSVLYEWNDSINRNLALLQFYFGEDMRHSLDFDVGKMFVDTGGKLELFYKKALSDDDIDDIAPCAKDLDILATKVYNFNLSLLNSIDDRSSNILPNKAFAADRKIRAR